MKIDDFKDGKENAWFCDFLGYEVVVSVEAELHECIADFVPLLESLKDWSASFYKKLEPMFFAYYKDTLLMCGETEPVIGSPDEVWKYITIGSFMGFSHDGRRYIMASGGCAWEQEHGLEFDVNESNEILYVGSFISNGFYENPDKPSYGNYVQAGS